MLYGPKPTPSFDLEALIEEVSERVAEKILERGGGADESPWLTVEQAAARAQINKHKIYEAVRTGELHASRPSPKCIRIERVDLDEWMRSWKT